MHKYDTRENQFSLIQFVTCGDNADTATILSPSFMYLHYTYMEG